MEYPKDPTVLPSAQRHTETYRADQGRAFTDGDMVTIQIPPTNHSYLTKDVELHFDFDMVYYEGSDANYKKICGDLTGDNPNPTYLTFNETNNAFVFTNDATGTVNTSNSLVTVQTKGAIPLGTYEGYKEVADAFNAYNPDLPIRLYFDDTNDSMYFIYGFLVQRAVNDQLLVIFPYDDDIVREANLDAGVYYNSSTLGRLPSISAAVGNQLQSVELEYNTSTNKFTFSSFNHFEILNTSQVLMRGLGFADPAAGSNYESTQPDGEGTQYKIVSTAALPAGPITVTNNTASGSTSAVGPGSLIGFTQTTPISFSYLNDGTQYLKNNSGTIVAKPSCTAAGYTPINFFAQMLQSTTTAETPEEAASVPSIPNLYRPYPTLDTNGPYSFFSSIEVYDYLGNTLLEKIPRHDLLTAIWTDLENSPDSQQTIIRPRAISDIDNYTLTKPNCSFLLSDDRAKAVFSQTPVSLFDLTEETAYAEPITLPKIRFAIGLYSFLGRLSEKFVPLHNGYTIKFLLNHRNNVIAFNTQQPNNKISYTQQFGSTIDPANQVTFTTTMTPSIKTYNLSNIYLRGDIITVPPELDSRIDKIVFAKGYKVQEGVPQNRAQRINTEVKSLTSVVVIQQPNRGTDMSSMRTSAFIRNYCPTAKLLYNKAVVSMVNSFNEAYRNFLNVFGSKWDMYLNRSNWDVDAPSSDAAWMQNRLVDKFSILATQPSFTGTTWNFGDRWYNNFRVALGYLPRYVLAFDTRLPGYTPLSVSGIDTRKVLLEVQLDTTTSTDKAATVNIISEFDTFIEVKPSESTAVSF